jgi:hypothetical protein
LLVSACAALSTLSCSRQTPADGFKDLKYGMSIAALKEHGFDCMPDQYECSQPSHSIRNSDTLFGKKAEVSIYTKNGHLATITVNVELTPDELIDLFTRELGKPRTYTYVGHYDDQREADYWLSKSNTAILVYRLRNKSLGSEVPRSWADYLGPEQTKSLIEEAAANSIRKGDF